MPSMTGNFSPGSQVARLSSTVALLELDDVVALSRIVEGVCGHVLRPEDSSRLKAAYQGAQTIPGGPTLTALAEHFAK